MFRNKSNKELKQIMREYSFAKRDFTSNCYNVYWAAWHALNENINGGEFNNAK